MLKNHIHKKWRRETQFLHVAASLLCGDIILQHLMTSFATFDDIILNDLHILDFE